MNNFSLEFRQNFLANVPFFAKFSKTERHDLAVFLEEVEYSPNNILVKEGELINKIYLIIEGTAEVLVATKKDWRIKKAVPVATLSKYEAIGLTSTGFFSPTGLRTASVRALTKISAFVLTVNQFSEFVKKHPKVHKEIEQNFALITRMSFIKEAEPFTSLSTPTLQALVSQVEKIHVKEGEIILKQGEIGESCYLIEKGKVEVYDTNETGEKNHITTLGKGKLFGEIALLTTSPRNASVCALENCELLVIHRDRLLHLIESDVKVSNYLMKMTVTKSRPTQCPNITAYPQMMQDKEEIIILKNLTTFQYFRMSKMAWSVWKLLDGKHSLQEIALTIFDEYKFFSIEELVNLIAKLHMSGFIQLYPNKPLVKIFKVSPSWWESLIMFITKILEAKYTFPRPDLFITRVYQKGGYLLFTPFSLVILFSIILLGGLTFIELAVPAMQALRHTPISKIILVIFVLPLIAVTLHEFSHALTTKSYGKEVHAFGVGWYWLGPIAFTDTSDMWLSSARNRIIVNLAGIFSDAVFAGILCIVGFFVLQNHPELAGLLWLFAFLNYFTILKNLDPMLEYDGYYVLSDLLDMPKLNEKAVKILSRKPSILIFKRHWREYFYWILAFFYIGLTVVITLLLQEYILKYIFPYAYHSPSWSYTKWILPLAVLFAFSMRIWIRVKSKQNIR